MAPVMIMCTGRGTHAPAPILIYNGAVPVPESYNFYDRHTVMDLVCDRASGGCGRAPRLSNAQLRELINALADTPSRIFDISMADL